RSATAWDTCSTIWTRSSRAWRNGGAMAGYGEPELSTVEAAGLSLGIVATRWHGGLVDHMVERAEAAAKACGVDDVVVVRVSGSGELPAGAHGLCRHPH